MVDITNVVNVSTAQNPAGLGFYNVNNVMCITDDVPVNMGSDVYRAYTNARDVETDWGTTSKAYAMALAVFGQNPNILAGGGQLLVAQRIPADTDSQRAEETIADAVSRLSKLVYFGGVITTKTLDADSATAVAQVVETLDCIFILSSNNLNDIEDDGVLKSVIDAGYKKTKCVLYTLKNDNTIAGAYAGRGFSTNYSAQNSCATMNLKDLSGFSADTAINQTVFNKCKAMGVDCYGSVEGLPKLFSFEQNGVYFDEVYNRLWFTQAMKVAIFNTLATTSTKIPQTERGVQVVKNAAKKICEQAVYNGFVGAGSWTGSETFGIQEDFYRNIENYGFYIYTQPVASQPVADRNARIMPVIQIACKESGAVHSSNLILYFNK